MYGNPNVGMLPSVCTRVSIVLWVMFFSVRIFYSPTQYFVRALYQRKRRETNICGSNDNLLTGLPVALTKALMMLGVPATPAAALARPFFLGPDDAALRFTPASSELEPPVDPAGAAICVFLT